MARPPLTEAELARVEEAVREAERGTASEVVVVVAAGPGPVDHRTLLGPVLAALAFPLPVVLAGPRLTVPALYTAQLVVLALGLLPLLLPGVRRRLATPAARRERVRRAARDQFFERGLHRTAARAGVLLYVAPAERCAEIIADAGAAGPLPDEAWRPCLDELLAAARQGRLADGIVGAVARIGAALRTLALTAPGDRGELPNRAVVL